MPDCLKKCTPLKKTPDIRLSKIKNCVLPRRRPSIRLSQEIYFLLLYAVPRTRCYVYVDAVMTSPVAVDAI